jgi:hypothetical protein
VVLPALSISVAIAAVQKPIMVEGEGQVFVEGEEQVFVEGKGQVFEEVMLPTELMLVGEAL